MNLYRVTLRHDQGTIGLTTGASTADAAVRAVLAAEHAPPSAVLSVEQLAHAEPVTPEDDVRGCSCGMADYGTAGHDGGRPL